MNAVTFMRSCDQSCSPFGLCTAQRKRLAEAAQDVARGSPDRDVLPLARHRVRAVDGARAEADGAVDRELADAVEPERIEEAVLLVGHHHRRAVDARQRRLGAGRRLPDAELAVGPREHAGDRAGGRMRADRARHQRIVDADVREVGCRMVRLEGELRCVFQLSAAPTLVTSGNGSISRKACLFLQTSAASE